MYENRPKCETCGHWWIETNDGEAGSCRAESPACHSKLAYCSKNYGCSQHTEYFANNGHRLILPQ